MCEERLDGRMEVRKCRRSGEIATEGEAVQQGAGPSGSSGLLTRRRRAPFCGARRCASTEDRGWANAPACRSAQDRASHQSSIDASTLGTPCKEASALTSDAAPSEDRVGIGTASPSKTQRSTSRLASGNGSCAW